MVASLRRSPLLLALGLGLLLLFLAAVQPRKAAASVPTITFGAPTGYLLSDDAESTAVADFDHDGHLDIVAGGHSTLQVLFGNGDGTFQLPPVVAQGGDGQGQVFAADLNNDGLPDIITANTNGGTIDVVLNLGNRQFSAPTHYPIGSGPFGAIAVDLNNDGFPDLVGTNTSSADFHVLINDKTGHFGTAVRYPGGDIPQRPVAADLNGDGNMDIVFASVESTTVGIVHVWLGDGTGKLNHANDYNTGWYPAFCTIADYNNDGLLDLATGDTFGGSVHVFFGNGAGGFTLNSIYSPTNYPDTIRSYDLNGDGSPDLVWADNGYDYFSAMPNLGNGTFATPPLQFQSPGAQNMRMLAIGDFNEDGRPDIEITDDNTHYVYVFANSTVFPLPSTPLNLAASSVTATTTDLAWTYSGAGVGRFLVEARTSGGAYAQIGSVSGSIRTFRATGLTPATSYSFRVRAQNSTGFSSYSNEVSVTTLETPPAAPSNLSVTATADGGISLQWSDNSSNEDDFAIERRGPGQPVFVSLAAVGANVTSYADPGLSPNSSYSYRVRAENDGGVSDYAGPAAALTYPAVPTGFSLQVVSQHELDLAWTDPNPSPASTKVERSPDGINFSPRTTVVAGLSSYPDLGLTANTTYYYRLRASNGSGDSAPTPVQSATTLPDPPPAATSLQAVALDAGSIRLTWSYTDANQTGFRLERKRTGAYTLAANVAGSLRTFTESGLLANSGYTYRIFATNAGGASPVSNEAAALTYPLSPTNASIALASKSELDVNWTDPNPTPAATHLERAVDGSMSFQPLPDQAAGVLTYADTSVSPGHSYTYRLRCFNTTGTSTIAATATGSVPAPPLAPVSVAVMALDSGSLRVSWAPGSNDQTGFQVQRQNVAGGWDLLAAPGAALRSYTDAGLPSNTTYSYRVLATNVGGASAPSPVVTGVTLPVAFTGFTLTTSHPRRLDLSWNDPNAVDASAVVERSSDGGGSFQPIATVDPGTNAYADTGLTPSTRYYYRVRAVNTSGASAYAGPLFATTLPPPPAPPQSLRVTVLSQSSLRLDWQEFDPAATGFDIERRQGSDPFTLAAHTSVDTTFLVDSGLTANTSYTYRVHSVGTGGESDPSTEVTATTLPLAPQPPVSVQASATGAQSVLLTWTPVGTVSQVSVERRTAAGGYATIANVPGGTNQFSDTGLTEATAYTYRLKAANLSGQSGPSAEVTVTTLPAAPGSVQAVAVGQQVLLTWSNNSTATTGFVLERAPAGGSYAQLATIAASPPRYVDDGLAANTGYRYRLRTAAGAAVSTPSTEVTATTTTYVADGGLAVSPTKLSFGALKLGKPKSAKLKLTNKGKSAITVVATSPAAPFTVSSGAAVTLAPKQSLTLTVTCSPTAAGTFTGELLVLSSDSHLHQAHLPLTASAR